MKVKVNEKELKIKRDSTIADALRMLKINPETVLVKRKNKLVPSDELLKNGDMLELVNVISGG